MTSFPRQHARTRRFTLGVPRAFTPAVGPDGPFVLYLRSDTGTDPVQHLWHHDLARRRTSKLVDARIVLVGEDAPSDEERARRERAREMASGIVAYATDRACRVATFTLAGELYTLDVATGTVAAQPAAGPAFDPRLSPDGRRIAYHALDGLHLVELVEGAGQPGHTRPLVTEAGVAWGRAEFVAAEEMGRTRGHWWADDGTRLAVARVDERDVAAWTIADPAVPWSTPASHRYPAAGTVNAQVSLWVVDVDEGTRTQVRWDAARHEYLAHVAWGGEPLTLAVQSRDQRELDVLRADPDTGGTSSVRRVVDDVWVEPVPGTPAWSGERLVTVEDHPERGEQGTRSLCLDGDPLTPPGLQLREVVHVDETRVVFRANGADPTLIDCYELELADPPRPPSLLTGQMPGVHRLAVGRAPGSPSVLISATMTSSRPRVAVRAQVSDAAGEQELEVVTETPVISASPRFVELGERRLRAALLLPGDDDGRSRLPVLLDPYGGPHGTRVVRSQAAHLTSQWLADQGFAVLVVDGRGTPGRGPRWEREVHGDLATPVLEDQLDALRAATELEPRLDPDRVGIRGWSFGGYLAALALLRRPDAVRAAVAGAPVTDWRLYDTHYTERYLGDPATSPEAYAVSSLVDGDGGLTAAAPVPDDASPQLLLIHGLADDNVVAAHTLRLSAALLASGRSHTFLPLSGVTHMTPQEVVAEQLLFVQVRFLHSALGVQA